jgi:primase-polymerase (primpol)-like protein
MREPLNVPDDLSERDQWVLWRYEERNGRPTKVPYQATGRLASSTDSRSWHTFEAVLSAWDKVPKRYAGVGFVFCREDPFCGIDLDDSLEAEGNVKPWAQGIVERFSDTYMEVSPSGAGLKIWARGGLPANVPGVKVGDGQIELYDHGRYFAFTGRAFRGAPLQIEDHISDLRALYDRLTQNKRRWNLEPLQGGRIPYGQQHSTLVSIAGTLRARRVCDEAIEACLQVINARQCEKPGPPEHIARIVHSSRKWGAA